MPPDQYSIFDFALFCPKELGTARGKNKSEEWLLTNLVIYNVHCSTWFFFPDNLDCALGNNYMAILPLYFTIPKRGGKMIFVSLKFFYLHSPPSLLPLDAREYSSTSIFTGMFPCTPGLGIDTVPNLGVLSLIKLSPSRTLPFSVLPFSPRLLESFLMSRDIVDSLLSLKLKVFRSSSNARCVWVCFCLVCLVEFSI
jgi:hypothetical protein